MASKPGKKSPAELFFRATILPIFLAAEQATKTAEVEEVAEDAGPKVEDVGLADQLLWHLAQKSRQSQGIQFVTDTCRID